MGVTIVRARVKPGWWRRRATRLCAGDLAGTLTGGPRVARRRNEHVCAGGPAADRDVTGDGARTSVGWKIAPCLDPLVGGCYIQSYQGMGFPERRYWLMTPIVVTGARRCR
jgi:hypothetical protein